MKKVLICVLALIMALACFAGCQGDTNEPKTSAVETDEKKKDKASDGKDFSLYMGSWEATNAAAQDLQATIELYFNDNDGINMNIYLGSIEGQTSEEGDAPEYDVSFEKDAVCEIQGDSLVGTFVDTNQTSGKFIVSFAKNKLNLKFENVERKYDRISVADYEGEYSYSGSEIDYSKDSGDSGDSGEQKQPVMKRVYAIYSAQNAVIDSFNSNTGEFQYRCVCPNCGCVGRRLSGSIHSSPQYVDYIKISTSDAFCHKCDSFFYNLNDPKVIITGGYTEVPTYE